MVLRLLVFWMVFMGIVAGATAQERMPEKYQSGADDGFSHTGLNFTVSVSVSPDTVCAGEAAVFAAVATGTGNYGYEWFRLREGATDLSVAERDTFTLLNTTLSDSGQYYCVIKNISGGDSLVSDTLRLVVRPMVVAAIFGSRDTVICPNNTLTLIGGVPLSGVGVYWRGAGILGRSDTAVVQVAPSVRTDYILSAASSCSANDTITVEVNRAFIDIPSRINVVHGESITLTAKDGNGTIGDGSKLSWYRDTVIFLGTGNPKLIPVVDKDLLITVAYDTGRCLLSASTRVYVKGADAFAGGADDGFSHTGLDFTVSVSVSPDTVCAGEAVVFAAVATGTGNYGYEWFRLRGGATDLSVSERDTFTLLNTTLDDSGQYYCVVKDMSGSDSLVSDTLRLVVRPMVAATIFGSRDTVICPDDTLSLIGGVPLSGVGVYWRGAGILGRSDTAVIRVAPSVRTDYILSAASSCSANDTITVEVNRAFIDIPSRINVVHGESITLTAKDGNGTIGDGSKLSWYRDTVIFLGTGNPKTIPSIDKDLLVTVSYDTGRCLLSASTRVYVKGADAFAGGADDGFSHTGLDFTVSVSVSPDTVCAGEAAVFAAVATGTGNYGYEWFRLRGGATDLSVSERDTFTLLNTTLDDSGQYYCVIKNISGGDSLVSDTLRLVVVPKVDVSIVVPSGRDTTVCEGVFLSLEVEVSEPVDSCLWSVLKKDGTLEEVFLPGNLDLVGVNLSYDSSFIWCSVPGRCGEVDTVLLRVEPSGTVTFRALADNRIGQCDSVDLREKLKPSINRVACSGGYFSVDSLFLPGDWWSRDRLRVGCHTVRYHYTKEANRCISVPEIELCVDMLPSARILLADNTCLGGMADSVRILFAGRGGITFELEQRRYNKYDPERTYRSTERVGDGLAYRNTLTWLAIDTMIVYRVGSVADYYGCVSDSVWLDTIRLRPAPLFELYSRKPHVDGVAWDVRPGWQPYLIHQGDSIGVKAVLTTGTPEWDLLINDMNDGKYSRVVRGIPDRDTVLSLKEARTYQFRVSRDSFCNNYMGTKYVSVGYINPGYVRMRVLLEGAYDADSAKMITGTGYGIPPLGFNLPVVGGKKIIDWLEVELRSGSVVDSVACMGDNTVVLTRDTCLLLDDGTVVDREGNEAIGLRGGYITSDSVHDYHIVLHHRNHLSVMTQRACFISGRADSTVLVDFTGDTTVYCSRGLRDLSIHMSKVGNGKWALSAGEVNGNDLISMFDPNRTVRFLKVPAGYHPYDVNFDGKVDWPGWNTDGTHQDWHIVKMNRDKFSEVKVRTFR